MSHLVPHEVHLPSYEQVILHVRVNYVTYMGHVTRMKASHPTEFQLKSICPPAMSIGSNLATCDM